MSEQNEREVRDGLRAAVSGEPPMAFDADTLMARARQQVRGRRALVAAGVATAGVAVAAVAVPTMLGTQRGGPDGAPGGAPPAWCDLSPAPPTPRWPGEDRVEASGPSQYRVHVSPSAGPCPPPAPPTPNGSSPAPSTSNPLDPPDPSDITWPPPGVAPKRYTAAELDRRGAEMQSHLRAQFGKVVPGATAVTPGAFQGEAPGDVEDGQGYLNAFTTFTVNGARYAVDIYTSAPGAAGLTPVDACAESSAGNCEVFRRADGGATVVGTIAANDTGTLRLITVSHFRPNGTVVRATGYNYDPTGDGAPTPGPAMPVTVEQLTALATDPALGL